MALVLGTVTTQALAYWPQFFGGLLGVSAGSSTASHWNPIFRSFKVGRGGWVDPGLGKVPRQADPSLTDLDVIVDAGRSSGQKRYSALTGNIFFFEKSLTVNDFSFEAPRTLRIQCKLDFGDFNDISGTPTTPPGGASQSPANVGPELFEMGIFSDHPINIGQKLMVLYGTFGREIKDSSKQLQNDFRLTY